MNAWDPVPWPHGWGVARDDGLRPDPSEPTGLARALHEQGAPCVNITLGNPYYRAHFNRPLDSNVVGSPGPDEHPLEGVVRLVTAARDVAAACPGLAVVGSGYSYLRQHAPQVAAGVVAEGWAAIVGLGREAFAYPEFARDILREGRMDPRRCCVACSRCTQLMRDGQPSGCPVRDRRVYGPLYREGRARGQALERS